MKKKTIAFFIPDFSVGGIEKAFITYANALVKDYQVSFIVIHGSGVLRGELSERVQVHDLNVSRLRFSLRALTRLLCREELDYVVSGTEVTNTYLVLANMLSGGKSKVITSQHNFKDMEIRPYVYGFILPWILRHSYHTFGVSKGIVKMIGEMGVKKENITLLYNPIVVDGIRQKAACALPALPADYIVFVGRLYPIKNLPLLIHAFHLFVGKYPDYSLIIVGDGADRERLEGIVNDLNLNDKVLFVGETGNPYPYMDHAKVVALSSIVESLSIVTLEAIALGVTVVSTPSKGPEEVLQHPRYGYVTDSVESAGKFSEALCMAVEHPIDPALLKEYANTYSIDRAINIFKSML